MWSNGAKRRRHPREDDAVRVEQLDARLLAVGRSAQRGFVTPTEATVTSHPEQDAAARRPSRASGRRSAWTGRAA